ncbi:MAG: FixH family protein [Bdellovibrionales bacterium]|nr:FixH family protein [Bdellovibrionales bacterium]
MKTVVSFLFAFSAIAFGFNSSAGTPDPVLQFSNGLMAVAQWEKGPVLEEESIMTLQFLEQGTGESVALDDNLSVKLWMPDMGHGSAPTEVENILNSEGQAIEGYYRVKEMYFLMAGFWQIEVSLTNKKGETETQILELTL